MKRWLGGETWVETCSRLRDIWAGRGLHIVFSYYPKDDRAEIRVGGHGAEVRSIWRAGETATTELVERLTKEAVRAWLQKQLAALEDKP